MFVTRGLKILLCILFSGKFNDGITPSLNTFLEGSRKKEKCIGRAETMIIIAKIIYGYLPFYSGCFCLFITDIKLNP